MQCSRNRSRTPVTNGFLSFAVLGLSLVALGYANQAQSQMPAPSQTPNSNSQSKLEFSRPGSAINTPEVLDGVPSANAACDDKALPVLVPALSDAYLLVPPTDIGRPQVVVAYYNLSEGLFAGYQSASGKRILFRGRWRANGAVIPEAAHLNPATGKIEPLMGPSKRLDSATGRRAKSYEVAGVDLLSYLKNGVLRKRRPSDEVDQVRQFMDGDAGRAFSEAIPALYATLEPLENNPKLVELQSPFGAILTALQLGTGLYGGFEHADVVLGVARANSLRDGCSRQQCRYRGNHFTIQNSGLFDSLSKSKGGGGKKSLQCAPSAAPSAVLQRIVGSAKNGDGICDDQGLCFGACGPRCFNPGDVWTTECWGHDLCVCKWGDASCVFSTPPDCDGCDTLIDAIESLLAAIFRNIFEQNDEENDVNWW